MKHRFSIAAFVSAAILLISCEGLVKPDQPSSVNPERTAEEEFWRVVGQLAGLDQRTPDYQDKIFTPTIGVADPENAGYRIVTVNDLGAAVERFNTLADANITEDTESYTYRAREVGTLSWNKGIQDLFWGEVDVDIPAVPSLRKIVYRSAEQGGDNASIEGSAYYRFGDVIQISYDEDLGEYLDYWICVRPSFGPEGKGKSHWISVGELPKAKLWPYYKDDKPFTASNGFTYSLPYNLGSDLEWHQDLAELLFAIMYPQDWFNNIGQYYTENILGSPNGLRIFNDWHKDNLKYHSVEFWKKVQAEWKSRKIVEKVFGISYDDMAALIHPTAGKGLYFLYDTYSWNTVTSNKPKLYQVHYAHGSKGEEKNMHLKTKTTVQAQVVKPKDKTESNINYSFDFFKRQKGDDAKRNGNNQYIVESRFFSDDQPRWCIRYAEGIELSGTKKYDPQHPIPGVTAEDELYRYYKDVFSDKNLTDDPEETK